MIDELDLAFEEQAERGKPRHRRGFRGGSGGGGKGGKGRTSIAFLMVFVLLGILGVGGYLGYEKVRGFFVAADYEGSGTEAVQVDILANASLTEIGNTLYDAGVVKSTAAFTEAAEANPKGKNIQSGTYNLKKQMSGESAVTLLLDPKARVVNGITITPGMTTVAIYALLAKETGIPVEDFQEAAKDPVALGVPDFWFKRSDGKKTSGTIEGFLYPDTYEFKPKASAEEILSTMVGHFIEETTELGFVDGVEKNLGGVMPYEALITASLVQAESGTVADMPKIARVAYNRAYKKSMPLQFDVTTNYWFVISGKKSKHSGQMTTEELEDPKNPYTTELKVGLPLGPINNPSGDALKAAQEPADGDWLFFVAVDKKGNSAFAVTNAEHDKNIQKACANGIPLC